MINIHLYIYLFEIFIQIMSHEGQDLTLEQHL